MEIVFLGTQGMQPTKERGLPAIFVSVFNDKWLVDCGEGTQRQMRIAGLKPTQLTKVFISHFHGDHMYGLGGILRNMGANEFKGILDMYGPKGIKEYVEHMVKATFFAGQIRMRFMEIKNGIIFENEFYQVEAKELAHSVPSFGISFIEKPKRKMNMVYLKKFGLTQHPLLGKLQKGEDIVWEGKIITVEKGTKLVLGKKLTIIHDTGFHQSCIDLAKDADLLISESTFAESEVENAKEYKHLTAAQSAMIAKKAKAKKLILTHFSQRYKDVSILKKEAAKVFKKVETADDFLKVIL